MSRHIKFSVDQQRSARNTDPEIAFINENSDTNSRKAGTNDTEITSRYPAWIEKFPPVDTNFACEERWTSQLKNFRYLENLTENPSDLAELSASCLTEPTSR